MKEWLILQTQHNTKPLANKCGGVYVDDAIIQRRNYNLFSVVGQALTASFY